MSQFLTVLQVPQPFDKMLISLYPKGRTRHLFTLTHIHSLVFSLRGLAGRNKSPVMWPVWLWHTASWPSSWG